MPQLRNHHGHITALAMFDNAIIARSPFRTGATNTPTVHHLTALMKMMKRQQPEYEEPFSGADVSLITRWCGENLRPAVVEEPLRN